MAVKTLDSLTALAPGADVWIVGDLPVSKWARKIDWYLNFQLTRAEPHKAQEMSPELMQVLEKWELEAPRVKAPQGAPLMVASSRLLPNSKTIQVPSSQDPQDWVLACHRIWLSLGSPTLRVFLPEDIQSESFEKHWPKDDENAPVEVVSDSELLNT